MANPYTVLNVNADDGDAEIRRRYLEAVRRCPPDRCPDAFQRIHEAYNRIKDEESRLTFLLFEPAQGETIDGLIEEEKEKCRTTTNRLGLAALLRLPAP